MLMIVSNDDTKVYELNTQLLKDKDNKTKKDLSYLHELIAHASLDIIESTEWTTTNTYLKNVDKFNEYIVSCFVTPGRMRFLFLHEGRSEDTIKNFMYDLYELYVKAFMNPFLEKNTKIFSFVFDNKVRALVKKHFS